MFNDLHAAAALLIQHPLGNNKLITAGKSHLNLMRAKGRTSPHNRDRLRRNEDGAGSESSDETWAVCECFAEAGRNPRCRDVRMEPAWPQGEEGENAASAFSLPSSAFKRKKDEEAEKDITKQNTRVLVGFRNAYVFDVSQTEGAELPAMREMSGEVGENRARLISFIDKRNIELVFTKNIAPALGMSYGGRIRVVVQTVNDGRIGAVELDRKIIDNAPEAPTPEPKLIPQPQKQPSPVAPLRPSVYPELSRKTVMSTSEEGHRDVSFSSLSAIRRFVLAE